MLDVIEVCPVAFEIYERLKKNTGGDTGDKSNLGCSVNMDLLKNGGDMRLFIAVQLSDEMKKALLACMHDLKKQGVELYVYLFIGEYDDPAKVKKVIGSVPLPQIRLSLSEKGNFGNLLWAGVKGNQKLKTYVKDLRAALKAAGIPYDEDKFIPHITLIRKAASRKPYQVYLPKAEMTVKKVSLMKSETKNGKAVYLEYGRS